ncbi:MAG: hypothetical protein HC827_01915 [Cyanobacteria bacterium RM1_2_2]|nr:hypothetical protein [Cyanobacteria bacterium RM1_2_2]
MPRSPWGGVGTKRGAEASGTRGDTVGFRAASSERRSEGQRRSINDDWEAGSSDREVWDDWGEPEPAPRRATQFSPKTNIRDTADDHRIRWDDERIADSPPRRSEPRPESPARPPDADRYRGQDDPTGRNSGVYDAEYRVLVPPYGTQPAAQTPPPSSPPAPNLPRQNPIRWMMTIGDLMISILKNNLWNLSAFGFGSLQLV